MRLTTVVATGVLLAACNTSGIGATTSPAGWSEPADYSFVLVSECGERSLLGTFDVTVEGHEVVAADALDESAGIVLDGIGIEIVPSIAGLVAELDEARATGADRADMAVDPGDGHPIRIDIDYEANAMDDEACYMIDDYRVTPG